MIGRPRFAVIFRGGIGVVGCCRFSHYCRFSRYELRLSGEVRTALDIGRRPRFDGFTAVAAFRGPIVAKILRGHQNPFYSAVILRS